MNWRTNRFTVFVSFSPAHVANILNLIPSLFLLLACEDAKEDPLRVRIEYADESSVQLQWLPLETDIEASQGYAVWRIDNDRGPASLEQIALVSQNWLYTDLNLPISKSLSYYVTTNINGKEYRSNTVECGGGTAVYALPSQMELIPATEIAILRESKTLMLLDFEKKNITKRIEFNGSVGKFAIAKFNGAFEVIIPCSDNNIYILKADQLVPSDTIKTASVPFAVTQNSKGTIFCSTQNALDGLLIFDRSTLNLIGNAGADPACYLFLKDDNHLLATTSRWTEANTSYYTFNDDGEFISRHFNAFGRDNAQDGGLMKVSNKYIVTGKEGLVFTADQNMTFVAKLSSESQHADFEFGADGSTVYSATIGQKGIFKSTIVGDAVSTSAIATNGYPLMLSRSGNILYILSSPEMTRADLRDSKMVLEKVALQ